MFDLSAELLSASTIAIRDCMGARPGERVLDELLCVSKQAVLLRADYAAVIERVLEPELPVLRDRRLERDARLSPRDELVAIFEV
jgi:hypothetical protein